jgi:hypothetical protein
MLLFFANLFYHPRYSRINDFLLRAYGTFVLVLFRVFGGKHILAVHVLSRYRYNPFLTKPDVRVTVRDSAAVAPAQRAIHALKRFLPLLDVVEIYTPEEGRTLETLLATPSGQLYPILERWRALQRCRSKKPLLKPTDSYDHFKNDVFTEELQLYPTLEQLTDRLLLQLESELALRIPPSRRKNPSFVPTSGSNSTARQALPLAF